MSRGGRFSRDTCECAHHLPHKVAALARSIKHELHAEWGSDDVSRDQLTPIHTCTGLTTSQPEHEEATGFSPSLCKTWRRAATTTTNRVQVLWSVAQVLPAWVLTVLAGPFFWQTLTFGVQISTAHVAQLSVHRFSPERSWHGMPSSDSKLVTWVGRQTMLAQVHQNRGSGPAFSGQRCCCDLKVLLVLSEDLLWWFLH